VQAEGSAGTLCQVWVAPPSPFSKSAAGEDRSPSQHLQCRAAAARRTTYLSVSRRQRCTRGRSSGRQEVGRAGGSAPLLAAGDGVPPSPASAACTPTRTGHPEPGQSPRAAAPCPSCRCWSPAGCGSLAATTTAFREDRRLPLGSDHPPVPVSPSHRARKPPNARVD